MTTMPRPRVLTTEENTQYSYDTPHRVNAAVAYPIPSFNGSRILIYGTESGVRIIWRGGRSFKPAPPQTAATQAKQVSDNAVMIIDSDEEDAPPEKEEGIDSAEFEDEEDEFDEAAPYPPIIQYLDLTFGASVTQVTTHGILISDITTSGPLSILRDKIIFAAACTDNLVRVVTLPLTPPSPANKARKDLRSSATASYAGSGKWNETVTILTGHSKPVDKVSMSFSAMRNPTSNQDTGAQSESNSWYLMLASHSKVVNGFLLLHKLPILSISQGGKEAYQIQPVSTTQFQTQYLPSPAIRLAFNPSTFSDRLSTRLLIADERGACNIYDCRSSASVDDNGAANVKNGTWLLTLFTAFQNSKSTVTMMDNLSLSNHGRKSIVDAQWALAGTAIIVLLVDGEWGIWDIEGRRSKTGKASLISSGIKGGATAKFSVTGYIDALPQNQALRSNGHTGHAKFAPMTPSTRKSVETSLFTGRTGHGATRGQIAISRLPAASAVRGNIESVVFWLEDSYAIIPNLTEFYDGARHNGGGSLFGTKDGTRLIRLDGINLYGERCCGIGQVFRSSHSKSNFSTDLLILGERRFLIVTDGSSEKEAARATAPTVLVPSSRALMATSDDYALADIDMQLDMMDTDTPVRPKKALRFV